MFTRTPLTWQVGHSASLDAAPAVWVPASVPGTVQVDWARAHGWGSVQVGDNWRDYLWMEDVYWTYTAVLPELAPGGERLYFVCGGVDYACEVRLNGRVLLAHEGMFSPFTLDLTGAAAGDVLAVVVFPAPKSRPEPADRVQANQSCKPAVSYGWDFHPRLLPLGIWEDAYLESRPASHLTDAEVRYTLADDLTRAEITVELAMSQPGAGRLHWELCDAAGTVVLAHDGPAESGSYSATLDAPELWWPNGQGAPTL